MSVTLKDVAEYLNMSVATVSRVVNGKKCVSQKTRARVLKAIKELSYTPNEVAVSLRKRNSKVFGILIPDINVSFFSNVIKGIESVARQHKYSIILCNSDEDPEREEEYLHLLFQKQVSALVISTVSEHPKGIQPYFDTGIPVVFIDNLPKLENSYDYVTIDNAKAAYDLTKHLIRLGHEKIAIITGPLRETTGFDRLKGWENAMKEHQLPIRKEWVRESDFSLKSGYKLMKEIVNSSLIPTALLACNNLLAYGAIQALNEHDLHVPENIAVVCFDGFDPTGLIQPQLTSIVQPAEDIGRIAAEIIIRKIERPKLKVYEKIILEPRMEIKASCGYGKLQ